jgi:pyruvate kinase
MRRAKIVCTLGPASLHPETIAAMIRAGMDVVRLNTSHGTLESHSEAVALVREVAGHIGKPVAVLMDLAGPKLRTGERPNSGRHSNWCRAGDPADGQDVPAPSDSCRWNTRADRM